MHPNVKAMLDAIAVSELGQAIIDGSDNGYNVLVGSTPRNILTFDSYEEHPNLFNHVLNSTAAGRYQFIHKTWENLADQLDLYDFSPTSQDKGGAELIRQRGALNDAIAGRLETALGKCAEEWASLPGGSSGQHQNSLESLTATYLKAGGTLNS